MISILRKNWNSASYWFSILSSFWLHGVFLPDSTRPSESLLLWACSVATCWLLESLNRIEYISLRRATNGHICTLDSGGVLALHLWVFEAYSRCDAMGSYAQYVPIGYRVLAVLG
jgi:hypothetical protein